MLAEARAISLPHSSQISVAITFRVAITLRPTTLVFIILCLPHSLLPARLAVLCEKFIPLVYVNSFPFHRLLLFSMLRKYTSRALA